MPKRKIKEIMTKEVITAVPTDSIKEVVERLSENKISGLPVIDENSNLIGMISEKDILAALKKESRTLSLVFPSSHALGMTFEESSDYKAIKESMKQVQNIKIEKIMNKKVVTAEPNNSIAEVSNIMVTNNVNRIPVIKKDKLIGIVTRGDIIKGLSKLA